MRDKTIDELQVPLMRFQVNDFDSLVWSDLLFVHSNLGIQQKNKINLYRTKSVKTSICSDYVNVGKEHNRKIVALEFDLQSNSNMKKQVIVVILPHEIKDSENKNLLTDDQILDLFQKINRLHLKETESCVFLDTPLNISG
jgi:hypothetical protein